MKPFLFLAIRAEDEAAENEYAAMLRFSGLDAAHLRRLRLERGPLGDVQLSDWSGILLGGGPFNVSDPDDVKSPVQRRVEAELRELIDRVVATDFPFFGACYGIGTVGVLPGGVVDRTWGEPIGCVPVTLSEAGRDDPLFGVLPESFSAFLGHKEAVTRLPHGGVVLASSPACPVQAFRLGRNVYATQFHPELDVDGLCTRIEVYKHHGYFDPPGEAVALKEMARASTVTEPPRLLHRFVQLHGGN
ncbi:MAG: glutamine amidotransferase [Nocardioidaceae bacterium]|nr:glutamine amidotransferase [Nocardioidaceae bacterium]